MGRRKVDETTRYAILHELLKRRIDGVLQYGLKTSVAKHFDVHRDTVAAIWSKYEESVAAGNIAGDMQIQGQIGSEGPLLASHGLVAKTTTIKPILKTTHRQRRMQYAMSFLDDKPDVHRDKIGHRVDPMLNTVHVDEKWFNHDKKTGWYYLLSGEDPPERHRHSARHIEKTMFWPRLLDQGYSAIQNLQYQTYVASTLEPIEVVQNLFRILDKVTLDNIFLTLQQVMVCVLACDGDNEYKLPHMGKAKQRRNGTLKQCVVCSSEVYASAFSKLSTEEVRDIPNQCFDQVEGKATHNSRRLRGSRTAA
ncbi:hypothetical protein F441_13408 [Phytophthora nicotianae CJ01A1]|uniref:DUF7769 domain-containing protein n=1 Tax=Phytophthora nicotianae CJ01A1 TaxID=1317063 RepID=W2WL09_PHYNI|nr:hypothetical protein F441_13408 [Phytophthora nicotianae CJ01A1]